MTGTSPEVLEYYSRNWEKIARCYELDEQGLPREPAWYRRRLYNDFLLRQRPASILDVGCGGGWTVLDALQLGLDARGVEPIAELMDFGRALLTEHGFDPSRIARDDLASCRGLPSSALDCIALLSVLPHVPGERWDEIHQSIAAALRPGGHLVAAYRNELFDLFTFNSFTVEFYDTRLWGCDVCAPLRESATVELLKELVTNSDVPGPYFTAAQDKSFGELHRMKSNPLTLSSYLSQFGLQVETVRYYHFHCVPPLMSAGVPGYRELNHALELNMAADWRGNFMAAMFLVEAVRR